MQPEQIENEIDDLDGQQTEKAARRPYEQSTIEFPYYDLDSAVEIAKAIHDYAGTKHPALLTNSRAFMKQSLNSGAFRARIANARTLGSPKTSAEKQDYLSLAEPSLTLLRKR